jgi:lipoprotein-anchoring transpeptidase ErfK/SrfK
MKANAEIASATAPGLRTGSWTKRILLGVAIVLVLIGLAAGGIAYATNQFAARYAGRILPGAVIESVNVSGMTPAQALATVQESISPKLNHRMVLTWKDRKWRTTPRRLGASSNAARAVEAAVAASTSASFLDKAKMRWLDEDLGFIGDVAIDYPRRGVRKLVAGIAEKVSKKPVDAGMDYSSGWVEITPHERGRRVLGPKARAAVTKAMHGTRGSRLVLPVVPLEPAVTTAAYDQVLLVRIGENMLYLYNDGQITHSWPVATGQPEYMTPTGTYSIIEKRYMPTWINPAPNTWGASMPPSIPPGPGNPLGLRALNWSAPAIRFHGTEATYSLGYNASHGCVRLSNGDVVELYDLVDVGTPIVSLVAAPLKPLYVSSPDPTPVADGGAGGTDGRGR